MINKIASTQYNDWKGGVAFDDSDFQTLSDYAVSLGHITDKDVIYGFEVTYSHLTSEMMLTISYSNKSFDELRSSGGPLSKIDFDLPVGDFFKLFKRANLAVAKRGL